jgi:hypothetical protein
LTGSRIAVRLLASAFLWGLIQGNRSARIWRKAITDIIGLFAGIFVLATFSMSSMLWLRLFAIASNVCFVVYGISMDLLPIWLLHALLLPMNCRFWIICLREKIDAKKSPMYVYHAKGRASVAPFSIARTGRPLTPQNQSTTARLVNGRGSWLV